MIQAYSASPSTDLSGSTQVNTSSSSTAVRDRPSKGSMTYTLAQVLRMPSTGPILDPMIVFKCPLCLVMVGRKAIAAHLRTVHQFEWPDEFEFIPSRDVIPGRLTCAHCKTTFSIEFALRAHFNKASCPVRLCQLASDLHFGPVSSNVTMQATDLSYISIDPVPEPRYPESFRYGLIRIELNEHEPDPAWSLLTRRLPHILHTVPFWAEVRLAWHLNLVTWIVHWPALPQVCLDLTRICTLVQNLCHLLPLPWAWSSDTTDLQDFVDQMIPETWIHQVELLGNILFQIEHTLAQNICLDRSLTS